MDNLTRYEQAFGVPREKWSKAQWKVVAHSLAGIEMVETRGRKKLTNDQILARDQNLRIANFWIEQARETESIGEIDGVYAVRSRRRKLTAKEAAGVILKEQIAREGVAPPNSYTMAPIQRSLIRAIQVNKKKVRDK
jgi:hypothetical protein